MNLAMRALGVVLFAAAFAGAGYAAFEMIDTDPVYRNVEMTTTDGTVTLPVSGEGTFSVTLTNKGNQPINVSLALADDRFGLQTREPVVSLDVDESQRVRAVLTVNEEIEDVATTKLHLLDTDRGDVIASKALRIKIRPELSISALEPGVLPGGNLTLRAELFNLLDKPQQFNLSVEPGTLTPASRQVRANASHSIETTVPVPPDAEGSFLVTFTATNATGRVLTDTLEVPVVAPGDVLVGPMIDSFNVAAGNAFSIPTQIVSNIGEPAAVEVQVDGLVSTTFQRVESGAATGGFVLIQVPPGAPATMGLELTFSIGDVERSFTVDVLTELTGEPVQEGARASVDFTARLTSGEIAQTSMSFIGEGPYARADGFQATPNFQPFTLTADPSIQASPLPSAFAQAMIGMHPGETQTIVLAPEDAYGGVRVTEELSATESVPRQQELPREISDFPKAQLPEVFDIENREEGDVVAVGSAETGGPFKFEIVSLENETVDLLRADAPGDELTLYSPWPNATEVTARTDTSITYRTTPPTDLGSFTWDVRPQSHQAGWVDAATVQGLNETHILLRFAPSTGTEYTATSGQQGPQTYTVEQATETTITVSTSNPNPLGGQTLIYDLIIRENLGVPQPGGGMQIGGAPPGGR